MKNLIAGALLVAAGFAVGQSYKPSKTLLLRDTVVVKYSCPTQLRKAPPSRV